MSMMATALMLAQAATVAAPPGWSIQKRNGRCALTRVVQTEDGRVAASFWKGVASDGRLIVTMPQRSGGKPRRSDATITLTPGGRTFDVPSVRYNRAADDVYVVRASIGSDLVDALPGADSFSVKAWDRPSVRVDTGPMAAAVAAWLSCVEGIRAGLGVDPAAKVDLPDGEAGKWFPPASYPIRGFVDWAEGRTIALLRFDRAGKPMDCRIVESSGHAVLDQQVCARISAAGWAAPAGPDAPEARWTLLPVRWSLGD